MQLIGQKAPYFELTAWADGEMKTINLQSYKGSKWVALFFYPLDFTFVCPTEILAYNERLAEFEKLNCQLLACSVDSQFSHRAWTLTPRKEGGIEGVRIPLLADVGGHTARAYGILNEKNLAYRGIFLIDPEGVIQQITINNNSVGRNVEETLRLLQAFQFAQSHPGEVCPANWTPGQDVMKSDPVKSKEYFSKHG